ncbi:hypothetical protein JCM19240_720 [Vibrio maritimus]|uniref:Uncharacterized protein n=1 Tax=Vibrio maritimus TaxID=990268 RepID=A0A090TE43_9VIBR|nr:hypothetical protein JCM19240_720 [Vibrio maritimus]
MLPIMPAPPVTMIIEFFHLYKEMMSEYIRFAKGCLGSVPEVSEVRKVLLAQQKSHARNLF